MSVRKTGTILLLTALLLSILTGCGAGSYTADSAMKDYAYVDSIAETAPASNEFSMSVTDAGSGYQEEAADVLPENRKWVITMDIDTETEDLDGALDSLNRQIGALGGYIQEQNIRNNACTGIGKERIVRQTNRTEKVGTLCNVLAYRGVLFIHRPR